MASNEGETKITLYWLNKSRSQRIVWLLEELNVKYDVKTFKRDKENRAPDELKEIHPLGKSPVVTIEVPGEKRIVLAESGVITQYLVEHFGKHLEPQRYPEGKEGKVGAETEAWLRYLYYLQFPEGTLTPFLLIAFMSIMMRSTSVPFFIRPIINSVAGKIEGFAMPEVHKAYKFLEDQLATSPEGGPFLCGKSLSGVDILLSYPLEAGQKQTGLTKDKYPKLAAYLDLLKVQEGYKRAAQKIIEIDGVYEGVEIA